MSVDGDAIHGGNYKKQSRRERALRSAAAGRAGSWREFKQKLHALMVRKGMNRMNHGKLEPLCVRAGQATLSRRGLAEPDGPPSEPAPPEDGSSQIPDQN